MNTDDLYKDDQPTICQIETLDSSLGLADETKARQLLAQAAEKVEPIMARRGWSIQALKEFNPNNSNLLGLNQKHGDNYIIFIRVRMSSAAHDERSERSGQVNNPNVFYLTEHILEVLLHQLAHIEHPTHDVNFYMLLEEITDECNRCSTDNTQPSPEQLRALRLKAFEKRKYIANILSQSSNSFHQGGCPSSIRALDSQSGSIYANVQREKDDVWCNETAYLLEKPPTPEPEPEIMDFSVAKSFKTNSPDDTMETGLLNAMQDLSIKNYNQLPMMVDHDPHIMESSDSMTAMDSQNFWTCSWCTLGNSFDNTVCSACQNPKEGINWNCNQCTYNNPPTTNTCMVCMNPK